MAVKAIVVEEDESKSQTPPSNGGDESKAVEMEMMERFGEMKQKFQDNEAKLAALETRYETALQSGEATQSQIRNLESRIAELMAALEEEEEEIEKVEKVIPPKPEEKPKPEERPVRPRSFMQKLLYG